MVFVVLEKTIRFEGSVSPHALAYDNKRVCAFVEGESSHRTVLSFSVRTRARHQVRKTAGVIFDDRLWHKYRKGECFRTADGRKFERGGGGSERMDL